MMALRIVIAATWIVACLLMAVSWWLDEPFGTGAKLTLAYAMSYVAVHLVTQAVDAFERCLSRHYH